MATIKDIADNLRRAKTVAVFSHIRPDGDTVGAALAVKGALTKMGKSVSLFCDGKVPEKFAFAGDVGAFSDHIDGEYDVYFAVDCSDEIRIGAFSYLFTGKKNTLSLDHHVSNTRFAAVNYVSDVAATCELCYRLIMELDPALLDKEIATALLLGISTDTGHFAHQNVTADTLFVAGKLVEAGADIHRVSQEMFRRQPAERAALFSHVMSGMQYFRGGKIAMISTSLEALRLYNATPDMTEGFIDFPLSVDGVEIAISILQVGAKSFKVSFRSKGKSDVNRLAGVFGGGGHVLASGCMLNGYFEDVVDRLVFNASNYLED